MIGKGKPYPPLPGQGKGGAHPREGIGVIRVEVHVHRVKTFLPKVGEPRGLKSDVAGVFL